MSDLNPDAFRNWLSSVDPNTVVGFAHSATSCPVANYFGGGDQALVTERSVLLGGLVILLPEWARRFIGQIDWAHPLLGEVTAAEALWRLDDATTP